MPASKRLVNKAILALFLASASSPYMIPCSLAADSAGSGVNHEFSQEVTSSYQKVKNYTFAKRYRLVDWANFHMEAINDQIISFQRRMGQRANLPVAEYTQAIQDLRHKDQLKREKIDALQDSSADSWDSAKQDFVNAAESLEQAYLNAVARLETHQSQ